MKTMKKTGETAFETVIEARRLESGQVRISGAVFDRACAIFPKRSWTSSAKRMPSSIVSGALT